MSPFRWIMTLRLLGMTVLASVVLALPSNAIALPPGFQESTVLSGLNNPTAVQFAADGRVFVAEKSGLIKVFDDLGDPSPTILADLRTNVHNFWDRGLLEIELHPDFPAKPYLYVFYVHDAEIGGVAPRWGSPGVTSDGCPTPPGATADGCVVSSRLSRLQVAGNVMTGSEQVLIEDWCQQYPSHAGSGIAFGADGALYVTGGDGANFNLSDYGQDGDPPNPCGDPPVGVGGTQTPPTAEGGRLRSQDLRTSGDPVTLDGSLIRVDPETGLGLFANPLSTNADPNARRIIAYGFRNPFRIATRPGTNEVWVGDVGGGRWEEIDRVVDAAAPVENFGWPCYEGGMSAAGVPASLRHGSFDSLNLDMCENLYREEPGGVTAPYFAYAHDSTVVNGDSCPTVDSSTAGLAFAPESGTTLPAGYRGALFFADYSRDCIWVMRAGAGGVPDPALRESFQPAASNPVNLQFGPGGDLFYIDFGGGSIRRIAYTAGTNQPPTAVAQASPLSGPAPLSVQLDGTGSSDPNPGDTLTSAWDLDDDGLYDDSTADRPTSTFTEPGSHTVRLRVTDAGGLSDTDSVVVDVDNTPPTASIEAPTAATSWQVGDLIQFSGSASDPEQGALPPSALSWTLLLHHCPGTCHIHPVQDFAGVSQGGFTAPDHEYPSHLELRLTATDAGGLAHTTSVTLDPQTVDVTFDSSPSGLELAVGETSGTAPLRRRVIVGSRNTVSATSPQSLGGTAYEFASWSDGGARTHEVVAPATATSYTATFQPRTSPPETTLSFLAEADARVEETFPTTNFGLGNTLKVDGAKDPDMESYLRFTVAGGSAPVKSAKLRVWATSDTVDGPVVFGTSADWAESAITWNNRPPRSGASSDDKQAIPADSWVEFDVTSLVRGDGGHGFVLAPTSKDLVHFASRQSTDAAHRPQLVVTFGAAAGDTQAPSAPSGLTATASGPTRVDLAWTAATDDVAVTENRIFRDGLLLATVGNVTSHQDLTTTAGTTYRYEVRALDAAGNESAAGNAATVTTPSTSTVTVRAEADTRVEESNPSTNFGTATRLRVDAGSGPDVETFVRFGATTVPGVIQRARLRVYTPPGTDYGTGNGPAAYATVWPGLETGLTWASRPARTSGPVDDKGLIAPDSWTEYDVTSIVTADGSGSFILAGSSSDGVNFDSREAARPPELVLTVAG